jgi:hypothetical protein
MHQEISNTIEATKRFHITGMDGHSEFWRRRKSPVEILELSRLLMALRKITSHIGTNVGDVVWSGMKLKHGIAIDPSPFMGTYPIPAYKTDIIVGITVQKAFAVTEWSERLKTMALSRMELPPHYAYKFNLYLDMCEKIYLDCLSLQRSVLGNYTEKAREWTIRQKAKQFVQPPTVTELLHIWWEMATDKKKYKEDFVDRSGGRHIDSQGLEKFYKKPLVLLNSIVDQLIHECPKINGVTERVNFRLKIYLSIWPELLASIKFWIGDISDPFLISDQLRDAMKKEEKKERKALKAMLTNLALPLERAVRKNNTDLTDRVKNNVKNVDAVVQIKGSDIVMPARNRVDKSLFHRLQLELKVIAQRTTRYNRGLTSGKIDRRRLYRAVTDGTAFQLKKNKFHILNNFVLLIDATGSMSDPTRWDKTETIFQTIFSAIANYSKNARLLAYNEVRNICRLTELYLEGAFHTVMANGQTASGEAIIATAMDMKPGQKKSFIIHITDGASNWGCGVTDALTFCKKKKINLLTLGIDCGPSSKQNLRKEYGKLVQFIDNINELPELVKSLLRHTK